MLALSLSIGIVLSAIHLTAQAERSHQRARQLSLMEDQAYQVFDLIERLLQQAGYVNVAMPMSVVSSRPIEGAIDGLDDATVSGAAQTMVNIAPSSSLASDLLVIRLRGDATGLVLNCAGFPVPLASQSDELTGRSILYIGLDPMNEPELRCHYHGASAWTSQAVASGVLAFQVRFGVDVDDDGLPNNFLSASQLSDTASTTLSLSLPLRTRIVALHIALLMRSPQHLGSIGTPKPIDLFGTNGVGCNSADDDGAHVLPQQLKPNRLHRQFDKIIFLNNSLRPDA
jgi:type IV pilus assembly protein PilW